MEILSHYSQFNPSLREGPFVVTIGNFDGIHLGHQMLLCQVVSWARKHLGTSVVLTFEPHPISVLCPEKKVLRITNRVRKRELIAQCGIDTLIEQPFDVSFAKQSPESFAKEVLRKGLGADFVLVGTNFRFGHQQKGTVEALTALLSPCGVKVEAVEPVWVQGETPEEKIRCSSTIVRAKVTLGQVEEARKILGRPFELEGKGLEEEVLKNEGQKKKGGQQHASEMQESMLRRKPIRVLGENELLPKAGVYMAKVEVLQDLNIIATYPTVLHIRSDPTFTSSKIVTLLRPRMESSLEAEVNVSSKEDALPLYGQQLRLQVLERLRDSEDCCDALRKEV